MSSIPVAPEADTITREELITWLLAERAAQDRLGNGESVRHLDRLIERATRNAS